MNKMSIEDARRIQGAPSFLGKKAGTSKYSNKKITYNGRLYDSKKEARRAGELDFLLKAGEIKEWHPQPSFTFELNGKKICTYTADFRVVYPDGREEIEDVKGVRTAVYRIKKKMLKAFYDIDVIEI